MFDRQSVCPWLLIVFFHSLVGCVSLTNPRVEPASNQDRQANLPSDVIIGSIGTAGQPDGNSVGCGAACTKLHPSSRLLRFQSPVSSNDLDDRSSGLPRVEVATHEQQLDSLRLEPLHKGEEWTSSHSDVFDQRMEFNTFAGGAWSFREDLPIRSRSQIIAEHGQGLFSKLLQDQVNFYSPDSLLVLTSGFVVGSVVANTETDEKILSFSRKNVGSDAVELLHSTKVMGEQKYTLPIFLTTWLVGRLCLPDGERYPIARWGERSTRAMIVGAPAVFILQRAVGASRPTETHEGSEWQPFEDLNGVSGHAFVGALPFITAAQLSESPTTKALWYAGSALVPLSRVSDNAHYPSQAFLGWWVAYLAASAVATTDHPDSRWRILPTSTGNTFGLAAELRF